MIRLKTIDNSGSDTVGLANVATRYAGYPTRRVKALRCNLAPSKDEGRDGSCYVFASLRKIFEIL
jgi:hypothetical protein